MPLVVRAATVGPFAENTYVVADTASGEALVIDPGGDADAVLALIDPEGFRVVGVVLTHAHVDHVAGCAELLGRLPAPVPVQLHRGDAGWLDALPRQAAMFGLDDVGPAPEITRWHEHGDEVALGKLKGQVIHTPGHSAGSCCLHFESEKILLAGDTLFVGSVGRTDLPGGDFDALERSIRERLFPLGDDVRFYPGHGPSGLLGDERRSNPFVGDGRVGLV